MNKVALIIAIGIALIVFLDNVITHKMEVQNHIILLSAAIVLIGVSLADRLH